MANVNSYLGVADDDYLFAKAGMPTAAQIGRYNNVASICAQAGEKYLKAVIELCFAQDEDVMSLLHSHNLRALLNRILTKYSMNVSSIECKWLGDFYFDARYPGDNFVIVNEQDARDCIAIVEKIKNDAERIIAEEERLREKRKGELGRFSAFDKA